jgi:hypothetical protein
MGGGEENGDGNLKNLHGKICHFTDYRKYRAADTYSTILVPGYKFNNFSRIWVKAVGQKLAILYPGISMTMEVIISPFVSSQSNIPHPIKLGHWIPTAQSLLGGREQNGGILHAGIRCPIV